MGSDSFASLLTSMFMWAFLPKTATNWAMQVLCRGMHPSDPRYRRYWVNVFTAIVGAYLLYTVIQVERELPPNYYALFSMSQSTFDQRTLKMQYRALSLNYHPDKNPGYNDFYVQVRNAYDILRDPLLRGVYDKFGASVIEQCSQCKTERDYLLRGLYSSLYFYIGTCGFLTLYSFMGQGGYGLFWRYLSLFSILTLEIQLLVSSSDFLATYIVPWRTTDERITILHQLLVVVSIALGQVGPVWFPSKDDMWNARMDELEQLSNLNIGEGQGSFGALFAPFRNEPKLAGRLKRRMERMIVNGQIVERNPSLKSKTQ